MKKSLSWALALMLICGALLQTAVPANAVPAGEKKQTIEAMNGVLNGVTYGDTGKVSDWSDETISWILVRKMIWDGYAGDPWMEKAGIDLGNYDAEGYRRVKRSDVEKIVRDIFGREFVPVEQAYMLQLSGDEVLFGMAAGEHTTVKVQDYMQQGNYYVAVGCIAWFGGGGSDVEGYFQAVFRENPDSIYGLTLISMEEIGGNQSFGTVTARASSVLSGGDYYAGNVLDGKGSTAWVEGAGGTGTGEWIELYTNDGSAMDLCAIEVDPGYHKSEDILMKNGWPSKLRVETDDGIFMEQWCYGTDTQVILLEVPAEARWVRITIVEAEAGTKYTDTCISEIRLVGIDTESYFRNLNLDLPEDQPAPEEPVDTAPVVTEPVPVQTTAPVQEEAGKPQEPEDPDSEAASVGIIGGADGPTAVLVTTRMPSLLTIALLSLGSLVLCAAIGIAIVIIRKRK